MTQELVVQEESVRKPALRGRKKHAALADATEDQLYALLPFLVPAFMDAVRGHFVRERVGRGAQTERVYRQTPDMKTAIWVYEKLMGKEPVTVNVNESPIRQRLDMSGFTAVEKIAILEMALSEQRRIISENA